ncbi:MAG: hypothetical protein WA208_16525 [Thermoanaerobaculia bacterium]
MPHYLVSWNDPNERLLDIAITFDAPSDAPRLMLPAWRPGRYLIQNYAANVRDWSATDASDVSRSMRKDGLTSWRVDARAGERITVRYRFYAGLLDAGSSFLDEREAYFNGTNLFMLVEGLREEPHGLTIAAPADWRIETQVPRIDEGSFEARNYDHLVDSPVIAAPAMTRHTFNEAESMIHLVFVGDEGIDTEQFVEPVRALVRTQAELFGGLPTREYRFLFHVADKWHGVEHEDSCSIVLRRDALLGAGPGSFGWDRTLSISSHELFHVWNVKRIVPARFHPYDYWNATPTRLLWVMEGMTSYFGELSMVRSGVWTVERYVEHLRTEIETLENSPARKHLSVAQASFDGWLASPAHMHDQPNAFFSFYNKGEIVALMLDLTIRQRTGGAKSLDDVVRFLWNEYGATGRGLEEDGFERAVATIADVGDFFARFVEGTDPLPYGLLATAGLEFSASPRNPESISLGLRLRSEPGSLVVESAIRGGAGMKAGLLPGDEIVAVDGSRTATEAALNVALRGVARDSSFEIVVSRGGLLRSLTAVAEADPGTSVQLRISAESGLRKQWLRRDE